MARLARVSGDVLREDQGEARNTYDVDEEARKVGHGCDGVDG